MSIDHMSVSILLPGHPPHQSETRVERWHKCLRAHPEGPIPVLIVGGLKKHLLTPAQGIQFSSGPRAPTLKYTHLNT